MIDVLNHYLSEMSDAILDHGGTLVAYMGDGIMAVFGAPIAQADHADRALSTAREMLGVRLPRFNAWMREQGLGDGISHGHRPEHRARDVRQRRIGASRRVHGGRRHHQLGRPHRGAHQGHAAPADAVGDARKDALRATAEDLVFVEEVELRGRRATTTIWSLAEDGAGPGDSAATTAPLRPPLRTWPPLRTRPPTASATARYLAQAKQPETSSARPRPRSRPGSAQPSARSALARSLAIALEARRVGAFVVRLLRQSRARV